MHSSEPTLHIPYERAHRQSCRCHFLRGSLPILLGCPWAGRALRVVPEYASSPIGASKPQECPGENSSPSTLNARGCGCNCNLGLSHLTHRSLSMPSLLCGAYQMQKRWLRCKLPKNGQPTILSIIQSRPAVTANRSSDTQPIIKVNENLLGPARHS